MKSLATDRGWNADAWAVTLILLACALGAGLLDAYLLKLLGKVMVLWLVALGLQMLVSHVGIISLGHAGFLAAGAYVAGGFSLYGPHNFFLMLACALVVCGLLGALMGVLVLRTQGLYQLMATLAIAQMMYYGFQSLRSLGGNDGFAVTVRPELWPGLALDSERWLVWAMLAVLAAGVWMAGRIHRSELGALMRATRDDAQRVASLGVGPDGVRLMAFVISAVYAGLGGALLAHLSRFTSPQLGSWMLSGELVILVLLGGGGTRAGLFGAAVAVVAIQEVVSRYTDHWLLALGVLVLVRVLWPARAARSAS